MKKRICLIICICIFIISGCKQAISAPSKKFTLSSDIVSVPNTNDTSSSIISKPETIKNSSVLNSSTPVSSETLKPKIKPKKVSKMTHDEIIQEIELTCGFDLPSSAELSGGTIEFVAEDLSEGIASEFSTWIHELRITLSQKQYADFKKQLSKKEWNLLSADETFPYQITKCGWGKLIGSREDIPLYRSSSSVLIVNYSSNRKVAITRANKLILLLLPDEHANTYTLYLDGSARNERYYKGTVKTVDKKGNILPDNTFSVSKLPKSLSKWSLDDLLAFAEHQYDLVLPEKSALQTAELVCGEADGKGTVTLNIKYMLEKEKADAFANQIKRFYGWKYKDDKSSWSSVRSRQELLKYEGIYLFENTPHAITFGIPKGETNYEVALIVTLNNGYGFTDAFSYAKSAK